MGLINYLMNSDGRRSLRKLDKMARKVEELEPKYAPMTDAQLREQTNVLKDRLINGESLDAILYDAFSNSNTIMYRSSAASPCTRAASPK